LAAVLVFSDAGTGFFAGVKDFTLIRKALSYNCKIRGIVRKSGAMGRVTEKATILLNQAIEAFLLEGSIKQRLGEMNTCIDKLEDYRSEISDELDELKQIRNILASSQQHLGPEHELEITERLLSLYVGVSEGALIF
jgi:hypothetical protein